LQVLSAASNDSAVASPVTSPWFYSRGFQGPCSVRADFRETSRMIRRGSVAGSRFSLSWIMNSGPILKIANVAKSTNDWPTQESFIAEIIFNNNLLSISSELPMKYSIINFWEWYPTRIIFKFYYNVILISFYLPCRIWENNSYQLSQNTVNEYIISEVSFRILITFEYTRHKNYSAPLSVSATWWCCEIPRKLIKGVSWRNLWQVSKVEQHEMACTAMLKGNKLSLRSSRPYDNQRWNILKKRLTSINVISGHQSQAHIL